MFHLSLTCTSFIWGRCHPESLLIRKLLTESLNNYKSLYFTILNSNACLEPQQSESQMNLPSSHCVLCWWIRIFNVVFSLLPLRRRTNKTRYLTRLTRTHVAHWSNTQFLRNPAFTVFNFSEIYIWTVKSSEMTYCIDWPIATKVSKNRSAFIFRVKESKIIPWRWKRYRSSKRP
jgi:hypothetical protein